MKNNSNIKGTTINKIGHGDDLKSTFYWDDRNPYLKWFVNDAADIVSLDVAVVPDIVSNNFCHLCLYQCIKLFFSLSARPSLRGSCPLDVAYSSLMDNNELALALRESHLEKIAVYLSRCGIQVSVRLIAFLWKRFEFLDLLASSCCCLFIH